METDKFDYIIIGGGTAGLAMASRLSEDTDITVLVIEAGRDHRANPLVQTPGLVAALYGNDEYDWNFLSAPQPSLHNRQINQARGRMLGGSSALNFMMLLYPSRGIMDAWAALGNEGWDYDSLSPYLRKFATVHAPPQAARDVVGLTYHDEASIDAGEGPIHVSFSEGYGPTNKAWMETFKGLGLEVKTDPRTGTALGAFQNPASIDPATKTRSYAANGYYSPEVAGRKNLVVMTETLVKRIVFDTSGDEVVATGVEISTKDGETRTASANLEVILAAGALQTPQILELSGIGGKELLEKHGIPVVIDNPHVGEGMQDHPIVCQSFEVADGVPSADMLRDPAVLQAFMGMYQSGGEGPLGQSTISVAYTPLVDGSGPLPADKVNSLLAGHTGTTDRQEAVKSLLRAGEAAHQYLLFPSQITITEQPASMAAHIIPTQPENYITVMTILNHPLSRGSVHITSNDIRTLPTWDPKYNVDNLDMEVLARAVQFVERLVEPSSPFGQLLKKEGKRIPEISGDNLEDAREIVRQRQISVYHVAGSCAMLPREKGGVVDSRLRVYGTRNLRVVDASVFPLEPSGNIQSVVYAVAERAADVVKQDRRSLRY
ncbi:hypothetical protein QBC47DRAFT_430764 [Echria macrotheca]|uniref:Glucose-methanol-choline oxidoreductase N-terminal domain-containing protein n=1 Tax=Echria macrotheca TaxID=438768 RepID=A0AAJ0F3R9_9PEZI|nr:hypothetical protein QBC47DRAFT_430764 [Echria macrotheca]